MPRLRDSLWNVRSSRESGLLGQAGIPGEESLVAGLRDAGCVFAEEEAAILIEAAGGDADCLERLVELRCEGAPLEPLVGWVEFAGLKLAVGSGTFVPRQRSQHLLDLVLAELRARGPQDSSTFVEAFAGVAPLASLVAQEVEDVRVVACEVDPVAASFALTNLGTRGQVVTGSVLAELEPTLLRAVDVIAAVPPYVPEDEVLMLPREARDYEPLAALSGGPDGLVWVRELITQAQAWLKPSGVLLAELSERQVAAAAEFGVARGWEYQVVEPLEDSLCTVLSLRWK